MADEDARPAVATRDADKSGGDPTDRTPAGPSALTAESAPTGREEKESLRAPKDRPIANDLHHWLAMTAAALVEASAYDDRAEIASLSKANDPNMTFESHWARVWIVARTST